MFYIVSFAKAKLKEYIKALSTSRKSDEYNLMPMKKKNPFLRCEIRKRCHKQCRAPQNVSKSLPLDREARLLVS